MSVCVCTVTSCKLVLFAKVENGGRWCLYVLLKSHLECFPPLKKVVLHITAINGY